MIVFVLLMLMMFVTTADVLCRMFYRPIPGIFELTRYCLAVIVFVSLGFSQIEKVHIAIDLFFKHFPIIIQRIIMVFISILALVVFFLVCWQMFVYAGRIMDVGLITTVLRMPVFPFVLVAAIGVLFFALALLADLIDAITNLIKGGEVK